MFSRRVFLVSALLARGVAWFAPPPSPRLVHIAPGWARNQINCVIFRRDSLVSRDGRQYVAFYDPDGRIVLGRRSLDETVWTLRRTALEGDVRDAHNAISIALDGTGTLHVAWNHHTSPLQYCRTVAPGELEVTEPLPMVGSSEARVTYPEFYPLPGGDLLFLYRDGVSGDGRLIINRFNPRDRKWTRVQDNLLSGEGRRSAYWQAVVDRAGGIHLSWVWRETPDVSTNHDLGYAVSRDGGRTWTRSTGEVYALPITAASSSTPHGFRKAAI